MSRHYPSCICETVTAGDNGRCTVCGNYWKYPVPVSDMTLREHFAAMAMQGILASAAGRGWPADIQSSEVTRYAVAHADSLIAELSK
jgi:hypothetical protein